MAREEDFILASSCVWMRSLLAYTQGKVNEIGSKVAEMYLCGVWRRVVWFQIVGSSSQKDCS